MPRVRKIERNPHGGKNYFLIDASFLANKFIPIRFVPVALSDDRDRIARCLEWWGEIEAQLSAGVARVYIPDICIAETFKTLAKKYYEDKWFKRTVDLEKAREKLEDFVKISTKQLKSADRKIKVHDVSTSRDLIVAVDRFYECFQKKHCNVSLPDLIVVATAKYLMDFYDIPKKFLHIVTLDKGIRKGSKVISEIPNAYDPSYRYDRRDLVFE